MKKLLSFLYFLTVIINLSAQSELKTTTANLNFRTSPEIKNNVIYVIPNGSLLLVDYNNQTYAEWIKINYKNKTGYVYYKYLKTPSTVKKVYYDNFNPSNTQIKYYINSKGEKVQSPTYYKSPPAGATAECRDGTYSFSRSRRGTCSHHGGVKRWLK